MSEEQEQQVVCQWLTVQGLQFWHTPNSTWTTSIKQKVKNKRLGVQPGIPDLFVVVPTTRSKDGKGHLLGIELKREKGGVVSPHQAQWIDILNQIHFEVIQARVCHGSKEAIEHVMSYLKKPGSVF